VFVEQFIPYPARLARPNLKETLIVPGSSPINVFNGNNVDRSKFKVNRTHTYLKSLTITETPSASGPVTTTYEVNYDFNARNSINRKYRFKDVNGVDVVAVVALNINWDEGVVDSFNAYIESGTSTSSFAVDSGTLAVKFRPFATMNGRTYVELVRPMYLN
jgi:hypothetical protein